MPRVTPAEVEPSPTVRNTATVPWQALDVLRGWAAALMVVNHVGYMLTAPAALALVDAPNDAGVWRSSGLQWAVLLGAFAPVVFFFVTGLGYGLKAGSGRPLRWSVLWPKLLLLVVADALMWRAAGHTFGLDFFGFIACSMALLAVLLRLDGNRAVPVADAERRWAWCVPSVWAAGGLLVALLGLRVVGGPLAERVLGVEPGGWLDVALGRNTAGGGGVGGLPPVAGVDGATDTGWSVGVSFPPIPWLVYPLAGFVCGAWLRAKRRWVLAHRGGLLVLAAVFAGLGVVGVAWLMDNGGVLHRWGTVSVAFVLAGFAVLWALTGMAIWLEGRAGVVRRLAEAMGLRGIAAFSVVPLHFLFIGLLGWAGWRPETTAGIAVAIGLVLPLSLGLARGFVPLGRVVTRVTQRGGAAVVYAAWAAGLAVALGLWWVVEPATVASSPVRRVLVASGQLVLCVMLVLPVPAWRGLGRGPKTVRDTPAARTGR